ncbi:MAG: DNA recombination/repair protein RecA, partial [Gammaproteobacteria bacterium]|nr:DNA recombination/repair protein RecA [Gammaproteobacteria bacterium]
HNLINKAGTWYSYGSTRIGQGKDNARGFLRENPAISEEIEGKIREKLLSKPDPSNSAPTAPEEDSASLVE